MELPRGRVVSVEPGSVTVSVDAAAVCRRCAAGRGCGAGLLTGARQPKLIDAVVAPGMDLAPGDEVELTLAPTHLLRAAALAYGLPLLGVIVALGIAWYLDQALNDALAVLLAIVGVSGGAIVGRHFLKRESCLMNLTPSVSKRHANYSHL